MNAPRVEGRTVATIFPLVIDEHEADARIAIGWIGVASGSVMLAT